MRALSANCTPLGNRSVNLASGVALAYWAALTTSEERKLGQFDESANLFAVAYEIEEGVIEEYAKMAMRVRLLLRVARLSNLATRSCARHSPSHFCHSAAP